MNHRGRSYDAAGKVKGVFRATGAVPELYEVMRDGLAQGLTPLYTHGRDMTALGKGYAAATLAAQQADIRILNPTREAFADFAEQTRDSSCQWVKAITVDHLGYRQASLDSGSGLNDYYD